MNNLTRRATIIIATTVGLLLILHVLESQWPSIALWAFLALSLTLGFGHGALDAVLLLAQFQPRIKVLAVSAVYLLCVLLAGWVFSWSVPWALLLLVLMSVWHFGELHRYAVLARISVGGASVMWPMLVAQSAMSQLLHNSFGYGFEAVWRLWNIFAYIWLILVLLSSLYYVTLWVVRRDKYPSNTTKNLMSIYQSHTARAVFEIVALFSAYLVLSPLLAFAIYFGLHHSLDHIIRVRQAILVRSSMVYTRYALAFISSVFVTAALLIILWWFLSPKLGIGVGENAQFQLNQLMPWLVVSLAAVTLPHLLLVSYSASWLRDENSN